MNSIDFNKQSISFKALNMKKLCHTHKAIARTELPYLKELGQKYDVNLRSTSWNIGGAGSVSMIEIIIRKLGDADNFIKRMFKPNGKAGYITQLRHALGVEDTTFKGTIDVAVKNYRRNSLLKKQDHLC